MSPSLHPTPRLRIWEFAGIAIKWQDFFLFFLFLFLHCARVPKITSLKVHFAEDLKHFCAFDSGLWRTTILEDQSNLLSCLRASTWTCWRITVFFRNFSWCTTRATSPRCRRWRRTGSRHVWNWRGTYRRSLKGFPNSLTRSSTASSRQPSWKGTATRTWWTLCCLAYPMSPAPHLCSCHFPRPSTPQPAPRILMLWWKRPVVGWILPSSTPSHPSHHLPRRSWDGTL